MSFYVLMGIPIRETYNGSRRLLERSQFYGIEVILGRLCPASGCLIGSNSFSSYRFDRIVNV